MDPLLILHPDLIKADPRGTGYGKGPGSGKPGTTKVPGALKMSQYMKVHARGKRRTGAAVQRPEMQTARSAHEREPYMCEGKGCHPKAAEGWKLKVSPPRRTSEKHQPGNSAQMNRVLDHMAQHGKDSVTFDKDAGKIHVHHPPSSQAVNTKSGEEGPVVHMEHGALSSEAVNNKKCPSCHAKYHQRTEVARGTGKTPEEATAAARAAATYKKSLNILDDLISKAKSDEWISDKISYLMKEEGKPQKQAIVIAYSMAGRSRKDIKKSLSPDLVLFL